MKKFLLTAFFALVGLSSVSAQTQGTEKYMMGDPVASDSELTSGTYFIRAHVNGDTGTKQGLVQGSDNKMYSVFIAEAYDLASGYTDNYDQVWQIEVVDDAETEGVVFKIKNLGAQNYLSIVGHSKKAANGNLVWSSQDSDDANNAQFTLEGVPGEYDGNTRFYMQLSNATNATGDYPFVHDGGKYLKYAVGADVTGSTVQFDFVKAEPAVEIDIKVMFPTFNSVDLGWQTITALAGKDPSKMISYYANVTMNLGGFNLTGLTDAAGNAIEKVTEAGQEVYAQGVWERELKTNQVFRIRFCPTDDDFGAMRYMLSTTEIETKRGGAETLVNLVPERLWYFTPAEGGYLLQTLYDTEKAVRFTKAGSDWTYATAGLADIADATVLELVPAADGDYRLKIAGTENAWVGDFYFELLTVWEEEEAAEDETGLMRLYPLTDDDFTVLADFAGQDEIEAAKANPNVENVKKLIDAYNAMNLEAAAKRLSYFEGTRHLGSNPGQYSDPNGELLKAKEALNAVIEKGDAATDEEIAEVIEAINKLVDSMEPTDLVRNGITAGVFYRFKTKLNAPKYISAISGGMTGGMDAMALTIDGERSNTVFYVQAAENGTYTVICFENGLVLPNMTGEAVMPALYGSDDASTGVKFKDTNDGCFTINVAANGTCNLRSNDNRDMVTADNSSADASRWFIERVEELPLTFYNVMGVDDYDDGWSSVYSPVALQIPANYERTTAFTGILDFKNYNNTTDINHVLATPIAANEDGTITIPANQPTLLYYDGKKTGHENPNVNESLIDGREHISYINVPILYGESTPVMANATTSEQDMLPLYGSYFAIPKSEETDYYTLHASHTNNFREYGEYETGYSYVPGFKAYISKEPDEITQYPICQINPNIMAPADTYGVPLDSKSYTISNPETGVDNPKCQITITLGSIYTTSGNEISGSCELYFKHTPAEDVEPTKKQSIRRIVSHDEYEQAERRGIEHSFSVPVGSQVDYYVYHPETDTKSAPRTFTLNSDGSTVEIKEVINGADDKVERYDLQGRKLIAPVKGINIVNGKKILVK